MNDGSKAIFEAKTRGNTFGRWVNRTLAEAKEAEQKMIEINCVTRCFNGKAPDELTVELMLKHLSDYGDYKYPTLTVVNERYYWEPTGFSDDWQFSIFRSLK